jgi:hypothetical protein
MHKMHDQMFVSKKSLSLRLIMFIDFPNICVCVVETIIEHNKKSTGNIVYQHTHEQHCQWMREEDTKEMKISRISI